ncbi:MAG: hypothetical protein KJZ47_03580 [Gemmatimonadales bacterium]|nr:hypothetical protein [Gemmatimonadales bacterium]
MWIAIGMGQVAFWIAMYPLVSAWAERIKARGRPEISGGEARIAELEARLERMELRSPVTGEVDAQDQRLGELEERLDFAERLLTRAEPVGRHLPSPPEE